ncbi:response regulator receiver protein [Spirochaeta thermophila DSM 6578]|uniref:Response regulator receiver protein n=1 Tax=Winmispira thermophila (strain ATCC 700085 / DSM 6578 / Z-1203) TaxID=869211 RepID=G0GDY4_WINT7|nr:response regulator [Spirochaeta thermophila]AEJ60616.1 response regulator receiver protein [Spirochaeta thermophila DSM 6578]
MKKALVVDDSRTIRNLLAGILEEMGIEVAGFAADGEEAIVAFQRIRPDLVTLDITMPRADGLLCLERMKQFDPRTAIVIISALSDERTALTALKKGAAGFIKKPFTPEEVKRTLSHVLEVTA